VHDNEDVSKKGMRRRGHNEGSIYQRADGRWVASVTLEHGKRKDVYGATRRQVAERLAKLQRDIHAGLPVVNEVLKVDQYLTEWLSGIEPHLRPRSYTRYVAAVKLHIIPTLGDKGEDKEHTRGNYYSDT
jgi:integrase